ISRPWLCPQPSDDDDGDGAVVARRRMLLTFSTDQGAPLAVGTPRALSARATPRSVVTVVPSEPRHIEPYRTEGGLLVIASDFSTVMGNHLFAVAPFAVWARISSQVLPVHLSTRIEPKLPPPVALVMTTAKHSCF